MPTENMWVDMLTKAKQGTSFKRVQSKPMTVEIDYDDALERHINLRLLSNPDK